MKVAAPHLGEHGRRMVIYGMGNGQLLTAAGKAGDDAGRDEPRVYHGGKLIAQHLLCAVCIGLPAVFHEKVPCRGGHPVRHLKRRVIRFGAAICSALAEMDLGIFCHRIGDTGGKISGRFPHEKLGVRKDEGYWQVGVERADKRAAVFVHYGHVRAGNAGRHLGRNVPERQAAHLAGGLCRVHAFPAAYADDNIAPGSKSRVGMRPRIAVSAVAFKDGGAIIDTARFERLLHAGKRCLKRTASAHYICLLCAYQLQLAREEAAGARLLYVSPARDLHCRSCHVELLRYQQTTSQPICLRISRSSGISSSGMFSIGSRA